MLEDPERIATIVTRFKAYMKGFLPDDGPFDAQGYRYVILMQIMEQATDDAKAELDRRAMAT